ncbi:hypothetical protein F511_32301 [Dorcoceras hygrometricum]|uniref:Uncharacterized protein n=1 Tax=Dorcoceras hygrometricum TaxID=472368 RepID=A0A2Z7A3J2_9LAMI|nr:hypothetical protein F511_32301 [Dorcoceras hygrometricum]
MDSQLVVDMAQLVLPREMPPRCRGRARGQIPIESEGHNDEMERSVPLRRRSIQDEDEIDEMAAHVEEMELVMASFQQMNPQTFNGDEPSSNAESWLQHITGPFDRPQPPSSQIAAAGRRRPPPPPPSSPEIHSGQFDEENPSVQISSGLLVQADEGVSYSVVDLIGVIYRNIVFVFRIDRLPAHVFRSSAASPRGRDSDPNSGIRARFSDLINTLCLIVSNISKFQIENRNFEAGRRPPPCAAAPLSPTQACARASSGLARETSALVLATLGDAWCRFMRGDRPLRHAPAALGARLGRAAAALVARLGRAMSRLSSCAGRTIGAMVPATAASTSGAGGAMVG